MDPSESLESPSDNWRDHTRELGMAAVDAMTYGLGGKLANIVIKPAAQRRREDFYADLCEAIARLEEQGKVAVEKLAEHDQFISTYLMAALAAVRTHDPTRRAALRNAVLNSALPDAPDDSRQQMYVAWVEALTPLHLRVLSHLREPRHESGMLDHAVAQEFGASLPKGLASVIVNDLAAKGLIRPDRPGVVSHKTGRKETRLTPLGGGFLSFISDPMESSGGDSHGSSTTKGN